MANETIGQKVEVALTKETVRGTAETPSAGDWLAWGTFSASQTKVSEDIIGNKGRLTNRIEQKATGYSNEISIQMHLDDYHVGKIMNCLYGATSTTSNSPEAGVNTHDFTIDNSDVTQDTYTISVIRGGRQLVYPLGTLTSVSLSVAENSVPMLDVTFLTKKLATTTGLTASYPTPNYFQQQDWAAKLHTSYAGIGGASAIDLFELSIDWTREVQGIKNLPDDTHQDILTTGWDMNATITRYDSGVTYQTGHQDHTSYAFRFTATDSDVTIGAASNPVFQVDIPNVKISERNNNDEMKSVVGEVLTLTPSDDTTNGFSLAQLINTTASY